MLIAKELKYDLFDCFKRIEGARNNPININEVNDNKRIYFRFFEIESSKVIRTKKPITRAIYEPREYVKNKLKVHY